MPGQGRRLSGSKEHCLVTYYFGHYYLLGNSWIVDPGQKMLIDFELTPSGKNLTGNMWISSEAAGTVTDTRQ